MIGRRGGRPRLAPGLHFPSYRHDPGNTPHPYRHVEGHSHGRAEPTVGLLDPAAPFDSEPYLFGFDLFNHGYFWESHIWWEALWRAHRQTGDVANLCRGLIRFAAASVKIRSGVPRGARKHCRATADLLDRVAGSAGSPVFAGIDLEGLAAHARSVADATPDKGLHPDLIDTRFDWWLAPVHP
ncbi:MAG: hypothetical protein ACI9WU_001426 [Myxococcota bacterium]